MAWPASELCDAQHRRTDYARAAIAAESLPALPSEQAVGAQGSKELLTPEAETNELDAYWDSADPMAMCCQGQPLSRTAWLDMACKGSPAVPRGTFSAVWLGVLGLLVGVIGAWGQAFAL